MRREAARAMPFHKCVFTLLIHGVPREREHVPWSHLKPPLVVAFEGLEVT